MQKNKRNISKEGISLEPLYKIFGISHQRDFPAIMCK